MDRRSTHQLAIKHKGWLGRHLIEPQKWRIKIMVQQLIYGLVVSLDFSFS
jgi:hypothetical protein